MPPTAKAARVAGAWYLSMVLVGPLTLIYIPTKLIVRGDAAATAGRILAHETLFRLGIFADLVGAALFVGAALALGRLFESVSRTRVAQMVAIVVLSATIACVNTLTNIAALFLFRGADFLAALDKPQREILGMLFIRLHSQGNVINEIFWGLWLFPLGILVFQSRFLPRFLGVWLIVNGFAYVALSAIGLFAPQYGELAFRCAQPALFGELVLMLWLLIKGAAGNIVPVSQRSPDPTGL